MRVIRAQLCARATSRRGFTFVELCLGMIVTAMVGSALAAFTLAMSNCWQQTTQSQSASLVANQLSVRLQSKLQDAKRIGGWRDLAGAVPAGFIYWRADTNEDGLMQYGELAVMKYDTPSKSIMLYVPVMPDPADMGDEWLPADVNNVASIDTFIAGITPTPLVRNVLSARLHVDQATSTTLLPTVAWTIQLTQANDTTTTETVRATLKAPAPPAE